MSVSSDVLALFKDDAGNMVFNDYLLQEITQVISQIIDGKLLEILEKVSDKSNANKEKHNNLSKLNEKFALKKFDNKNTNAKQWLQSFGSECTNLI